MADIAMATLPGGDTRQLDRNWGVVAAATVGLVLSLGTLLLYSFGVFVRPLGAEFGWNRTQLAGALAISQYSFAFSSPAWGALIDRYGPRAVMLPCVVCLSALVTSLGLLTPNLWHFYLVFLAVSLCAGGASPIGYSAVLVRGFDRHLGLALGLALMGVGIGAAVLPPLSQALVGRFGWREAYAVLGGLTLVVTLPAAWIATRNAVAPGGPRGSALQPAGAPKTPLLPLVRTRAFAVMCTIFVLIGTVSIGALASLVPIMTDRGFSPDEAARIASLTGLAAILGRGGIGWLLDRLHAPRVVAAVALLATGSFLLLAFGTGTGSAYLAAALLGTVVGAEVDFTAFFVRRYFGSEVFGRLYGLTFGLFIIGSGTGPILASALFDRYGSYQPGELLFAAVSVAVVALTFAMPAYRIPGDPARRP